MSGYSRFRRAFGCCSVTESGGPVFPVFDLLMWMRRNNEGVKSKQERVAFSYRRISKPHCLLGGIHRWNTYFPREGAG